MTHVQMKLDKTIAWLFDNTKLGKHRHFLSSRSGIWSQDANLDDIQDLKAKTLKEAMIYIHCCYDFSVNLLGRARARELPFT